MGILDEAIKEHLELKRQHGAGESELKQLEDEAFGAAERPGDEEPASDALAEAPTAFMAQPEATEADADEASTGRRPAPHIADLQEAPEQDASSIEAPAEQEAAEEEAPAMEHEAVPEPDAESEIPASHSTEERQAIAEQPTEMYDVEEELGDAEPEVHALSEEDEEFWDEKRLSDELDQALEAPGEPEVEAVDEEQEQPRDRDEDVLEETPDFLEEAPEDDQLWFEQKPPKDFDFDD